jgi:hypothetical protein
MNQDILRFWAHAAQHFGVDSILSKVPKFIQEPPLANDIVRRCVFVGLNPSFVAAPPVGHLNVWIQEHLILDPYPEVFQWNNQSIDWQNGPQNYEQVQAAVEAMALLHHDARNWYPFFGRVNALANAMMIPINGYVHLDIYLWLTQNGGEVAGRIAQYPALARRQECLFLKLLDWVHPNDVLCLYPRVGNAIYTLCTNHTMGFWRDGDWQPVPNRPLRQVKIYRLGNQQPITLFKPIRRCIPNGAWAMSNQAFQDVLTFFHNRYPN